jgi:hypothetical protein
MATEPKWIVKTYNKVSGNVVVTENTFDTESQAKTYAGQARAPKFRIYQQGQEKTPSQETLDMFARIGRK